MVNLTTTDQGSHFTPFLVRRIFVMVLILAHFTLLRAQQGHDYPRIGVFHWGGAPAEWYAKFDLVITANRGSNFARSIKSINPNTIVLPTRDWNAGAGIPHIPDDWYVRDSNGKIVTIYGGKAKLVDISNYCPKYEGKRYNEYLPEYMANLVDLSVYDGVASDGVWKYPYGTTDVDLDRNGINDWIEHGTPAEAKEWLKQKWLEGVHKVVMDLRDRIGWNKIIHLNSGLPHDFERETTNGATCESCRVIFSWASAKRNYEGWINTAPYPHTLLYDWKGDSKNDFYWMRFLLGITTMGDAYYSYSDKASGEHHYDKYYDEFDLKLGYPVTPMQQLLSTGTSLKGIWVRFFDNGAVIVNIDKVPHTVTDDELSSLTGYNGPYFRFRGGQDPVFNNGQKFDKVDLTGREYGGGIVGDAIFLVKNPATVVSDIIIDNVDAGTSPASEPAQLVGNWSSDVNRNGNFWTMGSRAYCGMYDYAAVQPGFGNAYAVFRPTIGVSGNYEVFEWHGYIGNDPNYVQEATNAPFTITYAHGATASGTINQSINYGKWNSLGTYYFEKGTNGNVKITNKDVDGIVMADAFKFVYKGDENDAIAPNEPTNLRSTNKTADSITLTWSAPQTASDGDVAVAYQVFRNNVLVGTPISNFYIDSGLSERTTYDYAIYAVDNVGNRSISAATGAFTTLADTIPPRIVSVRPLGLTSLDVLFSEPVEKASAEDIANYTIESNVTIFSAVLLDNLTTVHLTTSEHVIGAPYTLIVNNVKDRALYPNTIPPNSSFAYQGTSSDSVSISIAADDEYELYINGDLVGSGNNWKNAQTYSVPSIAGKNAIAVKAVDTGGKGGLVAEIDFKGKHFVSDESWKVSTVEQPNWESVTFDDVLWPKATSYGLHGVALPWAQYSNVSGISTTSNVKWIWSSDSENDNVVYFRFTINAGGDTTPPNPPTGVTVKTY